MLSAFAAWMIAASPPPQSPACTCLCTIPRLESNVSLKVGESATTVIFSRRVRDHTHIVVDKAGRYDIRAVGHWHDSIIRTDADGYLVSKAPVIGWPYLWVGSFMRRKQHQRYFALIGEIDSANGTFKIGKELKNWTPKSSGELMTFANDVRFKYANNRGCLALTVTRTA